VLLCFRKDCIGKGAQFFVSLSLADKKELSLFVNKPFKKHYIQGVSCNQQVL
jgi:hypothetical protein